MVTSLTVGAGPVPVHEITPVIVTTAFWPKSSSAGLTPVTAIVAVPEVTTWVNVPELALWLPSPE